MTDAVLHASNLAKCYGPVQAVTQVNLELKAGEIYGFLGLNGAGKTTTIRMLLGLIRPDRGQITIFGQTMPEGRKEILARTGSLVESATAWPNLSVRDNLEVQRRLLGVPRQRIDEVIKLLRLNEYADRAMAKLSLGNKQRLALARALMGRPRLLILDEPANGLDPAGMVEIRQLLIHLAREEGMALLMSSHLLSEVEQLADRVGIIHRGRMIRELDTQELKTMGQQGLELGVDFPETARRLIHEKWPGLELSVPDAGSGPGSLHVRGAGLQDIDLAKVLVEGGIRIRRLSAGHSGLEQIFMECTSGGEA